MVRRWKDQPAFQAILNELENDKNDRAVGIVAVALLEYALQLAIEASYPTISETGRKKLFDTGGMLSSFSRKIEFATVMDVIDEKARDDLRTLNKIRNEFAHDMNPLSFTSEKILPLCEKLPAPNFLDGGALVEPVDTNERMRRRFTQQTYYLLLVLIGDLEG
jgi:DNA-binding MltR family transcriptional regulator